MLSYYDMFSPNRLFAVSRRVLTPLVALPSLLIPWYVHAAVYGGGGIDSGITNAKDLGGLSGITSIRDLITVVIKFILDILLLLAVAAIIVAGVYLITSNGEEGQKDKAKRIIFYALAGVIVALLSRIIVSFVNNFFT